MPATTYNSPAGQTPSWSVSSDQQTHLKNFNGWLENLENTPRQAVYALSQGVQEKKRAFRRRVAAIK